jgi:DNA topoisomerase-1
MKLVVVESPAKCKKIAGFLGPDFRVLATMGHIRKLDEDLDALGLESDFSLRYTFIKDKAKSMNAIVDAAAKASIVYLCADDDREGEAIAYSVACLLKKDPTSFPRSVFHEITETAVKTAIANPRRIDMNKVYAQQARSVLDMMIGFTISPLLWKYVARGLSAGRCQTPALRLVHDKERAIKGHVSTSAWNLSIVLGKDLGGTMEDELSDQESVLNYLENVHTGTTATIRSVTDSVWTASPPRPLITSTLQQEVSAVYSLNPKGTMQIAQRLYEAGHITYMRTDNPTISAEAVTAAHAWVTGEYGAEYVGEVSVKSEKKGRPGKQEKATDGGEAHEAIRPTHMEVRELPGSEDWSPKERNVYAFIWRRSIQSTMAIAKGTKRIVKFTLDSDPDAFPWTSSQSKTTFQGWQILGKKVDIDSEDEEEGNYSLDGVKVGQKIKWKHIQSSPKHTTPPPRFTQATLVRDLEKHGIGRPSTFASLLDVLVEKGYVELYDSPGIVETSLRYTLTPLEWPPASEKKEQVIGKEKQKLRPTPVGESVLAMCLKDVPNLFEYSFTARMEERLDLIAKGEESWKTLCKDIWHSYKDIYATLKDSSSAPTRSEKVNELGEGYKAVLSKNGPLILYDKVFTPLPEGTDLMTLTLEQAKKFVADHAKGISVGNYEGAPILKKKGPYGEYLQWKETRIPFIEGEYIDAVVERLQKKKTAVRVGDFAFAVGQYGPYMYKVDLKKKTFVSIPPGIDPSKLTVDAAKELYSAGLKKTRK